MTAWRLTLLLGLGCGTHGAPDLNQSLARYNGYVRLEQADSIAEMYTLNGELLVPGRAPLQGPDSIRAFLAAFTNVRVDSSAMWADSISVTDSGVVQWGGYFQIATVAGQPPVQASGHFVALWLLSPDGHWFLRRMGTTNQEPS